MNVRDIPWIHVQPGEHHSSRSQAFVEIIGKLSKPLPDNPNVRSYFFLVPFHPYLHIALPTEWTREQCLHWSTECSKICKPYEDAVIHYHKRQPIHTCLPSRTCTTIEYSFCTIADRKAFIKHLVELYGQFKHEGLETSIAGLPNITERIWETPKTVPDTLKIAMTSAVRPCVWVDIAKSHCSRMPINFTINKSYDEWFVPDLKHFVEHVYAPGEPELSPWLRLVSFDGEMYSSTGRFTMAENNDPIMTLGNTVMDLIDGQPTKMRNIMFCLLDAEQNPNFQYDKADDNIPLELHCFKTERELLLAWRKVVFEDIDPDILTGYNIYQFDLPYIAKRAKTILTQADRQFYQFGRRANDMSRFRLPTPHELERRKRMAKMNGGKVTIPCPIQMFGRVVLDMMLWVKKIPGNPFKAYKLDVVSETLLHKRKVDLKPSVMFANFRGNKYQRYENARYCAVDCILVLEIMLNQNTCLRELAMSRHTRTDIATVVSCGQQKKCFNLMMVYGYARKYVCNYTAPTKSVESWIYPPAWGADNGGEFHSGGDGAGEVDDDEESKKFKGATVIKPVVGFHRNPVAVVDFESKYPTEMKSHNLCSSTFIGDESMAHILEPWLPKDPNTKWTSNEHVVFPDETTTSSGLAANSGTHFRTFWKLSQDKRFVNPQDQWNAMRPDILKVINDKDSGNMGEWSYFTTSFVSLVGEIITYLKDARVKLKKQLKEAKKAGNKLLEAIYDADQRAIKVIMNSLYGMFGANVNTGLLPCKCVAKSVTSIGREEIQISRTIVETKFNAMVVYGDTDSLFISKEMNLQQAFTLGDQVSRYITDIAFGKKAVLATEKVFWPFVVPKKKTYIGRKYTADILPKTTPGEPDTYKIANPIRDTTGTISNKLDSCDVHKEIFETMIQFMVMESDVKKAYVHLLFSLERLANNWYPMEKLTCRNKLNDNDNKVIKAVVIRNKIQSRAPGTEPKPGDIVPFIYIRPANPKAKVLECIEDPDFVRDHDVPLGLAHYIYLLEAPVACYFVRFPSLKVPDLFKKCMDLTAQSTGGLSSFFNRPPTDSPFPKTIQAILVRHLRDHLHLPSDHIQTIIQVWTTHFVWNPVPIQYHRNQITNQTLFLELDQEMKKPIDVSDSDEDEDDHGSAKISNATSSIKTWLPPAPTSYKRKHTPSQATSSKKQKLSDR